MAENKLSVSKSLQTILIVFLAGLFVFWGFRIYEIWQTAEGDYPREISVEATGTAYVVPDTAKVYLGVYTEGETTDSVLEENTEKMNAIMGVLEDLDIDESNIKTTSYSLYPNYQWTEDEGEYLDGYVLDQTVEVKLTEFDVIGDLLADVVEAGANVIGDVSFVVDDTENAKAEARMEAIEKVKEKAEMIEEASGLKLGKVLSYYEYESYDYGKGYYAESVSYDSYGYGSVAPMIEPGEQKVELTVSMSYRVK